MGAVCLHKWINDPANTIKNSIAIRNQNLTSKMANRDAATNQIENFKRKQTDRPRLTTSGGAPVDDKLNTLTAGPRGPILLQDITFIDEIAHFDRERIPERVVHAKGAGAFGYFEVTHDITDVCKAAVFAHLGKQTPIAVRFSTVGGESGSADSARDPRGFAVKFYTEEGNWDLVGNNTPIFFFRDRGTPQGYRHMNGYGSHTFKMVNAQDDPVYVKFHYKTNQGIKCFDRQQADNMSRDDPDFAIRDLYNAIAEGDFPSYTMFIQVMTFQEAEQFPFNPFDLTKVWSHADFPLIPVGKLVLNKNPKNYFAEVEQLAFSPAHLVPGIEPSPDKMLQGRLFSYSDTHRHRLGANYLQIPVNCPYRTSVKNYQRDGPMTVDSNQEGCPNYFPNSFSGPSDDVRKYSESKFEAPSADVARFNSADEDNFTQCGIFFRDVLNADEQFRLVDNIAAHIQNAQDFLQERAIKQFLSADKKYGEMLRERINFYKRKTTSTAAPAHI